ncbi:MAG: biotin/lipoyl-binding protein [Lachnospiraceae bacterium]|nr:biotin/lipoyl-binding protein [Lachnospiraceae bacterium]
MNKHIKRLLIVVLVLALVGGGTYGGLTVYRNMSRKPVNVYPVENFAQTNMWMDQSESSGNVKMDNMQKIYLSSTQTVTEVFVREGQNVKAGDPLIAFDTTLSKLDVEKAEIALEKQKMELDNQQKILEKLKYAHVTEDLEAMMNALQAQLEAAYQDMPDPEYPRIPRGKWTEDSPRYMENTGAIQPEELLKQSKKDHIYVVLIDVADGQFYGYYGLEIRRGAEEEPSEEEPATEESSKEKKDTADDSAGDDNAKGKGKDDPDPDPEPEPEPKDESIYISVFNPIPLEPKEPEQPEIIAQIEAQMQAISNMYANAYSRTELAEMKESTAKAITDLELEIRIAEVNLEKAKAEVNDGTVCAQLDGVIESVLPIEEMGASLDAVLVLSGGGGYYVTGSIGEFDREKIVIGQTVSVMSYMNGMMYEGTITEVGDRPAQQNGWSGGNNNVSWYPFTVFVDSSAELQEGDWVGITYNAQNSEETDSAWYLEKFMIRSDNGRYYVYKRGEDGLLVKQYISTGKIVWSEYYEIRGGITMDDYIAFPYGRDVTDGAETNEATIDQLYESMY